jgi:hypothetical protein
MEHQRLSITAAAINFSHGGRVKRRFHIFLTSNYSACVAAIVIAELAVLAIFCFMSAFISKIPLELRESLIYLMLFIYGVVVCIPSLLSSIDEDSLDLMKRNFPFLEIKESGFLSIFRIIIFFSILVCVIYSLYNI